MNNPDHISESLETFFGLKYLNSLMRIRDGKIRIQDPGSATLVMDIPLLIKRPLLHDGALCAYELTGMVYYLTVRVSLVPVYGTVN
jgi:hypothetical protein